MPQDWATAWKGMRSDAVNGGEVGEGEEKQVDLKGQLPEPP